MKTLLLIAALLFGFTSTNAQSPFEQGEKNFHFPDEKDFPDPAPAPGNNLREIVLVPLNETDSTYDAYNQVWNYTRDAAHQYSNSNCKDTVITYYLNGVLSARDFKKWNSTGVYQTYNLNQTWDGANWINNAEYQTPVQFGCYIDYLVRRTWNGNSWDTISGIREVLSFDIYGRISQRHYTMYVNSQWVTYRQVYPHYYGVGDTVSGIDDYRFSTVNGQLIYAFRDTNYVWLTFSSFCYNTYSEYCYQTYDIPTNTWNNEAKYQYAGYQTIGTDTFYNYLSFHWNGASYDTASRHYIKHDYVGNWVEYVNERYDSISQTWLTDYAYQYNYTYGPGDEILRKEYVDFYCSPYFDLLTPCYVYLYSNFVSCEATGFEEINSGKPDLRIFPSPTQSELTVNSPIPLIDAVITVHDIQGRKMNVRITLRNTTAQLDVQNLPDGFYILQITNNKTGESEIAKFVKQQ